MSDYKHLSSLERDRIAELRASGQGVRAIARALNRSGSTISRELRRNALPSGAWRPTYADGAYLDRRQRPARLESDKRLRAFVVDRLMEGWTPEQISGWLRRGVEKGLASLSAEAIYAFLSRPAQKDEKLWRALPRRRPRRKSLRARRAHEPIKGKVHISERSEPAEVRAEAGHWEADLMLCKRSKLGSGEIVLSVRNDRSGALYRDLEERLSDIFERQGLSPARVIEEESAGAS